MNDSKYLKSAKYQYSGSGDPIAEPECIQDLPLRAEHGYFSSSQKYQFQPAIRSKPTMHPVKFIPMSYEGQHQLYNSSIKGASKHTLTRVMPRKVYSNNLYSSPHGGKFQEDMTARAGGRQREEFARGIKLFFKPLNKKTTRDGVMRQLSELGSVSFLRVPFSQKKRKNLGYGFVVFESKRLTLRLMRNELKVDIDGKAQTFEEFDLQKFKYRPQEDGQEEAESPDRKADSLNQLHDKERSFSFTAPYSPLYHFWKPTSSGYHQAKGAHRLSDDPGNMRINVHCLNAPILQ